MVWGLTEIALAASLVPLLAASAFCSASETALFGLTADERVSVRRSSPRTARTLDALLGDPRQLLITVLLANMSVNVLYFVISSMLLTRARLGVIGSLLIGLGTLAVIVVFSETLPKLLASAMRRSAVVLLAPPMLVLHRAIAPARRLLDRIVIAPLGRLTTPAGAPPRLGRLELAAILEQSGAAGIIDADEQQLLRGVFELRRLRVRDVMTPRVDMAWLESKSTRDRIAQTAAARRLTRLPVAGRGVDDIVGILDVKRYLLDKRGAATPIEDHLRRPRFVPELATVERLIDDFRADRADLAIVVDEYGGTAGVVAIEDCIEEIVGDIVSPEEEAEPPPVEIRPGEWIVPGEINLRRWADAIGASVVHSPASTLGGLILERLGRPANVGDEIRLANVRLQVEEVRGSRIRRVRVRLDEDALADPHGAEARP